MSNSPALGDLRDEIDRIDDQIHDLLMRRTEIVGQIGALKRSTDGGGLALRPGREAMIIRRIVARHGGAFPAHALVRIWRELLSAQVGLQGAFSVAVYMPDGDATFRNLGRAQYGSGTPMTPLTSANQVLQRVSDGLDSLGVLPVPSADYPDHWWRGLASGSDRVPRIVARLPFAVASDDRDRTDAFAVALVNSEETGDDVTLLAVELAGRASRDRLSNAFESCGLEPTWLAVTEDQGPDQPVVHLASVPTFIAPADGRLPQIADKIGPDAAEILPIGGYATPLRLSEQGAAGQDGAG